MPDHGASPKPTPKRGVQEIFAYKKGDLIGQNYEVYGILGKGGFGVVYKVYSHETGGVYALKTFRDEYFRNREVRNRFHKEANVWVDIGPHPYLVNANFVDEISGRLFIVMDYIAPNEEGMNSLEGYLLRRPPDLAQSLRWAIQICLGMAYAYSKGVRAHRDLKPANIMITRNKIARITDFGLAGVLDDSSKKQSDALTTLPDQTMAGIGFGTPTHMPSEQFENAASCDERSDIYSFGIILYQLATGGMLPFPIPKGGDTWQAMHQMHRESLVPRLDSPLFPNIQLCLQKLPEKRYQSFNEARIDLEILLKSITGEEVNLPQVKELKAWEWSNKGLSLSSLGRHEEAIRCLEKAIEINPHDSAPWCNKGVSLTNLDRDEEAILCFDQALFLNPRSANYWTNKGSCLKRLGRYEEAILCIDKAFQLDPNDVSAWNNKGNIYEITGRHKEAIACYDQVLAFDPRHAQAWYNKGNSLDRLGLYEEAVRCLEKTLELDPYHTSAWNNKGGSLDSLGRHEEAILCYGQALELDPRDIEAWYNKALTENDLGYWKEAACSFQQFLSLAPVHYTKQIDYARKRLRELRYK
jgi:tetratricopeptide (TPR) repeat protein/tRNA A-37 threonylcarbamoyl transferase component Bud32